MFNSSKLTHLKWLCINRQHKYMCRAFVLSVVRVVMKKQGEMLNPCTSWKRLAKVTQVFINSCPAVLHSPLSSVPLTSIHFRLTLSTPVQPIVVSCSHRTTLKCAWPIRVNVYWASWLAVLRTTFLICQKTPAGVWQLPTTLFSSVPACSYLICVLQTILDPGRPCPSAVT